MTEQLRAPEGRRRVRRGSTALLALAACLSLTACGSDEPPEAQPPTAAVDLPSADELTDPSDIVEPGEWGVVKVAETAGSDKHTVVAIKVSEVTRGEPGQLSEVRSVTGNSELIQTGTPYWITIRWAPLTEGGLSTPMNGIWGVNVAADQAAMKLSLPRSVERCTEPSTQSSNKIGMENVSCAAAMFEDQTLSVDQVLFVDRTTYPEGDHSIRFAVPTS